MLKAKLSRKDFYMEITLSDLWNVLKRAFLLMLICALLLAAVVGIYTAKGVQKVYTSSTDYVLLTQNATITDIDKTSVESLNNALVVGAKAIPTLASYLITETVMESVLRYVDEMHAIEPENTDYILDHTYTESGLKSAFSFRLPKEETDLVFGVSCRAYSAHDSFVLLNAFGEVVNERAVNLLDQVFYIEPCDPPKEGSLTSPHLGRNMIIAGLIGAVLPYLAVLIVTLLDTRIKEDEDLKNTFPYPLLGQIPHF